MNPQVHLMHKKARRRPRQFLSERHYEVIAELLKGQTNQQIAEKLFITEKTVKYHLTGVYKKLHVKSRADLLAVFIADDCDVKAAIQKRTMALNAKAELPMGLVGRI